MESPEGDELCFPHLLNTSCRKPPAPGSDVIFFISLLSFISLLTAALNLLVIISISHFRHLHNPTNLLILSLAVSDFLVGFLLMPVEIFLSEACWVLGEFMCALYYILSVIITSSSVGNMVLISIERFLAICDPLHYPIRVTLDRTKICVCLCWMCSILYNSLILQGFLKHPDAQNSCYGECVLAFTYVTGTVDFVCTFIAPITVIVVLYVRVFAVAVSQARAVRVSHTAAGLVGVKAKKSEMKAAMILGVVVMVFLICFPPCYVPSFVSQEILNNNVSPTVLIWLLFFNSCLNPVIYAVFYPWFRKSVKLIFTLRILQSRPC